MTCIYIDKKIGIDKVEKSNKAGVYLKWLRDRGIRFDTLNDNEIDRIPYVFFVYNNEDAVAFKLTFGL